METTADRIHVVTPESVRRVEGRRSKIDWAHNPAETTRAHLVWAFLMPITMAALVVAVNVTSILAMR